MILFRLLKLFGIDVPARLAAVRANIERRVETAKEEVARQARTAAIVAALSALAALAVLGAIAIGLVALYGWVADNYGHFYGLAAIGGFLILVAVILLAAALVEAKSWASPDAIEPKPARVQSVAGNADRVVAPEPVVAVETNAPAAALPRPEPTPATAADLVDPLSLVLSRVMKFPTIGNPVLDALLLNLRDSAKGVADEAVDGVVRVVRHGERSQLVGVLGTAMLVGWLMARNHPGHIKLG